MIAVGVPEISPVLPSITNPGGSAGDTVHESTLPPSLVGITELIGESFDKLKAFGLYSINDGGTSLTSIVTVVELLPPALVAVTL